MAINDFLTFKEEIRTVLIHLYDPDFEVPEALYAIFHCEQVPDTRIIQEKILAAIAELEPGNGVPTGSRERRNFDSLYLHYNRRMTQEEVAKHLHLSVRHLQRTQSEAIHLLTGKLWRLYTEVPAGMEKSNLAADWRTQAAQEFSLLRESAPNVTADIESVIQSVLALDSFMVSAHDIHLEIGSLQSSLTTTVHPSILRQTLISAISCLAPSIHTRVLKFYTVLESGRIKITLAGPVAKFFNPNSDDLTREILITPEMDLEVICKNELVYLNIRVPMVGERTVLVVEDNPDMVYFYRRCTSGTTYNLHHISAGSGIFRAIETIKPDIILLDVMLPDMDGWQLLTHLHEQAVSRDIPVVVCSVVKEENLALALGACAYLSKPVQPQRFVEALDLAFSRSFKESQADLP
jgi:CheY-like chemotaxis protein